MSGIHGCQHVECLGAPAFAHDDPVRPHAQRVAHQFADIDVPSTLLVGRACLQGHQVVMIQTQLRGVFNGDDAFAVRNLV